jgi:hypothetical protein
MNIFRSLWKIVFKLENEECNLNRIINLRTLEVLASRNSVSLTNLIDGDKDYFSNIASEGEPLYYLVYFLAKNNSLFYLLNEDAKIKVRHSIETSDVGRVMGWFIKPNLSQHAKDITEWIISLERPKFTPDQFDALLEISDTAEWQSSFCRMTTTYYTISLSFDQADSRFQVAIPKYIHLYDKEALLDLATKIEENGQCWHRSQAMRDYEVIKKRIDEQFDKGFPFEDYPNFQKVVVIED